jgi:hypothetical protein
MTSRSPRASRLTFATPNIHLKCGSTSLGGQRKPPGGKSPGTLRHMRQLHGNTLANHLVNSPLDEKFRFRNTPMTYFQLLNSNTGQLNGWSMFCMQITLGNHDSHPHVLMRGPWTCMDGRSKTIPTEAIMTAHS